MKFKQLRIRNYRGVDESTVEFADSGVTLVQGPNEIGKTSLAESIHLLFQFKASSADGKIKATKPVHRDVGTEIELEAESGPYHFKYRKQFHKGKSTELEILAPKPANYTGDEAHERANRILDETLDKPLWDALIVRQGDMISQPNLKGKAALMQALDSSAGGAAGDDREAETLFERVAAEYYRFFQKNDRPGAVLTEAEAALADARSGEEEAAALLADMGKKSERAAAQKTRLTELKGREIQKRNELSNQRRLLSQVEELEKTLAQARLDAKTAEAAALRSGRESDERRRLVRAAELAAGEAARLEDELAALEPAFSEAAERERRAVEILAGAQADSRRAEAAALLARGDFDHLNDRLHLDMMRERKERLDGAKEGKKAAERELAATPVDRALTERIKEAELAVTKMAAQLETEAPRVTVKSLAGAGVRLLVAGEGITLESGGVFERAVTDSLGITVPDRVEITVDAGGNLDELAQRLAAGRERLAGLCAEAGVPDSAGAMAALERRRRAERTIADYERIERENLRDLTHEDLAGRIEELAERTAAYATRRKGELPAPENPDQAKEALAVAEGIAHEARSALERESEAHAVHKRELDRAALEKKEARIAVRLAAQSCGQAESAVSLARASVADEELENNRKNLEDAADRANARARELEDELREKNPDKVRAMADALSGAVASVEGQIHGIERELAALSAELSIRGEEGLFERWQDLSVLVQERSERLAAVRARAAAAAALHRAMREERDGARRAYMEPLKNKIEELGRVVWDPSFRVEMNEDDLSIESRTLGGVTVPFASLSGGAREQLSLIFRAACAILVSKHSGMPLILDDALGYTDTERLHLMGAVLAKAAEQCQVVVFTCVPERYATIGNARVVQL